GARRLGRRLSPPDPASLPAIFRKIQVRPRTCRPPCGKLIMRRRPTDGGADGSRKGGMSDATRREFIGLIGGAATPSSLSCSLSWPPAARAPPPAGPRGIGLLGAVSS